MDDLKEIKISSKTIYKGKILSLELDEVKCPNGNTSYREVVRHNGGVCIMAKINDKFILEKQYRYPYDEIIYEFPAGKIECDDIYNEALRELEEETGYKANNIKYMGKIYPSCGYTSEVIHLFYADDLIKTQTNFDDDEIIFLEYKSLDELIDMIKENKIKDAKTICAINNYIINYK